MTRYTFSRQAMEEIHGVGGIAQIISGRSQLVDYHGTTLTKVNITRTEGFVLGDRGEFVGTFRTTNGVKEEAFGQFGVGDGKSKLQNGTVRQVHPNGEVTYIEVRDGRAYRLVLKMPDGNSVPSQAAVTHVPCPGSETGCIQFDLKEGQAAEPTWSWEVVENDQGHLNLSGLDITDGLIITDGQSYNVSDGVVVSIDFSLSGAPAPTSNDRLGEDLYILTNGILNDNAKSEGAPTYLTNLKEDIVSQSQGKVSDRDIITASTFFTSPIIDFLLEQIVSPAAEKSGILGQIIERVAGEIIVKVFNGGKDLLSWLAEAADPYAAHFLVEEIQASMKAYFDFYGQDNQYRDIIAMGYSGGFVPTVETLNHPGYNAKTLIALGAATIRPNDAAKDLMVKILEAADYLSNPQNVSRTVIEAALTNLDTALFALFGLSGTIGKGLIEEMIDFIAKETPKDAYALYQARLAEINEQIDKVFNGFALDDLTRSNTDMIINMYGSKDILGDLKINGVALGGYRESIGGFTATDRDHTLVNIEIVGASHFDYMRRGLPGDGILDIVNGILSDGQWNEVVSAFVANVAISAADLDTLLSFLNKQSQLGFAEDVGDRWIIRLPGSELRA